MSAWYMLLDPRFSVHPGPGRLVGGAMGSAAGRKPASILKVVSAWMARRHAIKELEALSDRMLSDIGVCRYEIPAIVDGVRTGANIHGLKRTPVKIELHADDEVLAA